nr:PREDICTED: uncharacterized protein LOC107076137 [Lepisosteus oculatus]
MLGCRQEAESAISRRMKRDRVRQMTRGTMLTLFLSVSHLSATLPPSPCQRDVPGCPESTTAQDSSLSLGAPTVTERGAHAARPPASTPGVPPYHSPHPPTRASWGGSSCGAGFGFRGVRLTCLVTLWALGVTAAVFLGLTVFLCVRLSAQRRAGKWRLRGRGRGGGQPTRRRGDPEEPSLWLQPRVTPEQIAEFWYSAGTREGCGQDRD